jgi:hypothetical protein
MPSNAEFGGGTLVQMSDGGSPETYAAIGELRGDISLSGMESDEIEVTTHNAVLLSRAKEKIPGLIDPGNLEFEINYVASDATHIALRNVWQNQIKRNFRLLSRSGALVTLVGYVMTMPITYPVGDSINAKIKIMITGLPAFS